MSIQRRHFVLATLIAPFAAPISDLVELPTAAYPFGDFPLWTVSGVCWYWVQRGPLDQMREVSRSVFDLTNDGGRTWHRVTLTFRETPETRRSSLSAALTPDRV